MRYLASLLMIAALVEMHFEIYGWVLHLTVTLGAVTAGLRTYIKSHNKGGKG